MAKSTAPILAIGGVAVLTDNVLFGANKVDFKILAATGFTAVAFAMVEKANQKLVVGVAWIALLTTIMVRKSPGGGTLIQHLESLLHSDWRGEDSWTRYTD